MTGEAEAPGLGGWMGVGGVLGFGGEALEEVAEVVLPPICLPEASTSFSTRFPCLSSSITLCVWLAGVSTSLPSGPREMMVLLISFPALTGLVVQALVSDALTGLVLHSGMALVEAGGDFGAEDDAAASRARAAARAAFSSSGVQLAMVFGMEGVAAVEAVAVVAGVVGVEAASWARRRPALTSEAGRKPFPSLIMPPLRGGGTMGGGVAAARCWRWARRDAAGCGVREILPALAVAVEGGPMGAGTGAGLGAGTAAPPGAGAGGIVGTGVACWMGTSRPDGRGAAPLMLPASSMVRPCCAVPALKAARLASKVPSARAVMMLSLRVGGVMGAGAALEAWRAAMRWENASGVSSAPRTPPFLMVGRVEREPE